MIFMSIIEKGANRQNSIEIRYQFVFFDKEFVNKIHNINYQTILPGLIANYTYVTETQEAYVLGAMKAWEEVGNVRFTLAENDIDLYIGASTCDDTAGSWAYALDINPNQYVFLINNKYLNNKSLDENLKSKTIFLHELGHVLKLSHVSEEVDHLYSMQDTVMSYNEVIINGQIYYPVSPMPLDIQAIQYLYG